jgi:hypothetical protein
MGQLGVGSMPSSSYMLPIRSHGIDGPVLDLFALGIGGADHVAALESAAGHHGREDLAPMAAPAVPGASHMTFGVRPNSPLHQTMVLSSRPRSDKSWSSVAMPLSISGSLRRMVWKFCLCVSQPL